MGITLHKPLSRALRLDRSLTGALADGSNPDWEDTIDQYAGGMSVRVEYVPHGCRFE